MPYVDHYKQYLDRVSADIEFYKASGKKMVLGYTSDLDVLIKWNTESFNRIVKKYLKSEPSITEGESIGSVEDFARIITHYALAGLGGEVDISNVEVCNFLEREFETQAALGGTCAQAVAALGSMGFPLIAHITDRCTAVCSFMDYPGVSLVSAGKPVPIAEMATDEIPVRHMILQYSKGDRIDIAGQKREIPVSNRMILDYDSIHKRFRVSNDFLDYVEANAKNIVSYSISGFNAYVDQSILNDRLATLRSHYEKVKVKSPGCVIFLEGAHYLNSESKSKVFGTLSGVIDVLSMNEEELVDLSAKLGCRTDKGNLDSILTGLETVCDKYPVKGLVLHTKDYSMYYGGMIEGVDIEKGLTLGNLMSATRARIGVYGSQADCENTLSLGLSPVGLMFAGKLDSLRRDRYACIVPSRYMETPACTIGLGDTFMAGMQLCFIR